MKVNNGLFSIIDVASTLHVSPQTVRNWCKWWETEKDKPPDIVFPVIKYIGKNKMRMFDLSDIMILDDFKKKMQQSKYLKQGIMKRFYKGGKNK